MPLGAPGGGSALPSPPRLQSAVFRACEPRTLRSARSRYLGGLRTRRAPAPLSVALCAPAGRRLPQPPRPRIGGLSESWYPLSDAGCPVRRVRAPGRGV